MLSHREGRFKSAGCRKCNILVISRALVPCLKYMHSPSGVAHPRAVLRIYQAKYLCLGYNLYIYIQMRILYIVFVILIPLVKYFSLFQLSLASLSQCDNTYRAMPQHASEYTPPLQVSAAELTIKNKIPFNNNNYYIAIILY